MLLQKNILLLCAALLLTPSAHAGWFGYQGSSGRSGFDGQSGRSPVDSTVRVTGQPFQLNLAGEDGMPGERGGNGERAYSCAQPMNVPDHLYGASGGDGGKGGDGGDAGRGGDVTFVYSDLSQLSNVLVYAPGGRGARGAESGRGGNGCRCSRYSWVVRRCVTDPQGHQNCRESIYSCNDGRDGFSPMDGQSGRDARPGMVHLMHTSKTLTPDHPNGASTLGSLFGSAPGSTPVTLSRNLFNEIPAIGQYLAPGSVVSPTGSEFDRQKVVPTSFTWSAPQKLQDFASTRFEVELDMAGNFYAASPDDLWLDLAVSQNIGGTEQASAEIKAAYRPKEIGHLSFVYIEGSGSAVVAQVDDLNHLPTDVPVSFKVLVENKVFLAWKDRWFGDVPSTLVQKVGAQYRIAVGQLPIDLAWLTGRRTRITVTAEFKMGGKTKTVRVARIASL